MAFRQLREAWMKSWQRCGGAALALLVSVASASADEARPESTSGAAVKTAVRAAARAFVGEAAPAAIDEAPAAPAGVTHEQVRLIQPAKTDSGLMLKSFCLRADGKLVTLVAGGDPVWGGIPAPNQTPGGKPPGCEVRIVDADGKLIHSFPVDFSGHSVNVGPDGNIYVGGNGIVAKYDAEGKQLVRTDAPNMTADSQSEEALRRRAMDTFAEQKTAYADAIANLEKQKQELAGKSDEELTEEQREIKPSIDSLIEAYKQAMAQQQAPDEVQIKQIMDQLSSRQKTINAIAANDKYVFVTCSAPKGYGYVVWRTDLDFKNPVMTVEGLRGCCGQMDVQCCGDELVVAENSRHRVVRFDADGKEVLSFGKRSRDGIGEGFGSCCNPMNTRLVGDQLYVAESDGSVKLFSQDGKFLGLIGKANVQAGCKSSIVAATPDGETVYYFDVQKSGICVLEKKHATPQASN